MIAFTTFSPFAVSTTTKNIKQSEFIDRIKNNEEKMCMNGTEIKSFNISNEKFTLIV